MMVSMKTIAVHVIKQALRNAGNQSVRFVERHNCWTSTNVRRSAIRTAVARLTISANSILSIESGVRMKH